MSDKDEDTVFDAIDGMLLLESYAKNLGIEDTGITEELLTNIDPDLRTKEVLEMYFKTIEVNETIVMKRVGSKGTRYTYLMDTAFEGERKKLHSTISTMAFYGLLKIEYDQDSDTLNISLTDSAISILEYKGEKKYPEKLIVGEPWLAIAPEKKSLDET